MYIYAYYFYSLISIFILALFYVRKKLNKHVIKHLYMRDLTIKNQVSYSTVF